MSLLGFRLPTFIGTAMAFAFISTASAGTLSTNNCLGGGVIVTNTSIDWTLPVGGTTGCTETGLGTNVDYLGFILGPAVQGTINDLPGGPGPVGFMTFDPIGAPPPIFFDLSALGPANVPVCPAGAVATGFSCKSFAASPFVLTQADTGTTVTLAANGIVRSQGQQLGSWFGSFTTQLVGRNVDVVVANINSGGSESSTYSGAFITIVPEPGTITLSLIGGLFVALAAARKKS